MSRIKIKKKGTLNINESTIKLVNLVERGLPKILGNEAVNFYKGTFKKQGWTSKTFEGWQPRKVPDVGRAILVQSGDLRRSIVKTVGRKKVVISTNVKYAEKHNSGLGKMPKRQFMGDSEKLKKNMKDTIVYELTKLFK